MFYIPSPFKWCSRCRSLKCFAEFPRNRSKKDGFSTECHICNRKRVVAWAAKHPEEVRRGKRLYLKRHPQRRQKSVERYLNRSRDIRNQRRRNRYEANRNSRRIISQRRRALQKNASATLTVKQWSDCLEHFHGVCAYCGHTPRLWDKSPVLTQDHFIPVSAGGEYTIFNIVPACDACNSSKRDKSAKDWLYEKIGKRKANQVLARIQRYFDSVAKA